MSNSYNRYRWRPNLTKEQIAQAREVPLLDYLQRRGYKLRREGRYYRFVEHDSLVVDPVKNRWHWNSRDIKSGSTPDFLAIYEGMGFEEAVMQLLHDVPVQPLSEREHRKEEKKREKDIPLVLPKKNEYHARTYAYLTKTRGISPRLVQELLREELVYEAATSHNAVFVRYVDGKAVGYFERGTNTYGKPFKRCPSGSDKRYEFLLPGKSPEAVLICEAAIDCLSVESLRRLARLPPRGVPILSLGGNALPTLQQYLLEVPTVARIVVCTDNDQGGETAWNRICDQYAQDFTLHRCCPPDPYKDWNEVLVAVRNKQCPPSVADVFKPF